MAEILTCPKGTFDILPQSWGEEPWRSSQNWQRAEGVFHRLAQLWGFEELRTPILELAALFQRGVGEDTDVVAKEMYTFTDRAGRLLAMRPEGTLGVARAIIETGKLPGNPHYRSIQRNYYIGPYFRYERPQAGRYRQFHQFGTEMVGASTWQSDVELLDLAMTICAELGLKDIRLHLNTLGDRADRLRYRRALIDYLEPKRAQLSPESARRLSQNPLRILDSKDPGDREVLQGAPALTETLAKESSERFARVQEMLEALGIPYHLNPKLVRGLDYYTHTVFEVTSTSLGSQDSILGGGRYDDLFEALGHPPRPALGFGLGIERVLQVLSRDQTPPRVSSCEIFFIALGNPLPSSHYDLARQLRRAGLKVHLHVEEGKLSRALQIANQLGSRWVLLAGAEEIKRGNVQCKDMVARTEIALPLHGVLQHMTRE